MTRCENKGGPIAYPGKLKEQIRGERAEHVLRAMSKIDDPKKTEDNRQPETKHRVE